MCICVQGQRETGWLGILELTRLYVDDGYGSNIESCALGKTFQWLRENDKNIKVLLSYADNGQGHVGGIYKATNWIYQGLLTPGGLVGQYSAFGNFKLAPEQTMLIEFGDTGAPYMGIQLGNRWFVSMDYENRTSTLNMNQLGCREDESRCYA